MSVKTIISRLWTWV